MDPQESTFPHILLGIQNIMITRRIMFGVSKQILTRVFSSICVVSFLSICLQGNRVGNMPRTRRAVMAMVLLIVAIMMMEPSKNDHQVGIGLHEEISISNKELENEEEKALEEVFTLWNYETTQPTEVAEEQVPTDNREISQEVDVKSEFGTSCFQIRNYDCRNCDWVCDNCPNKIRSGGKIGLKFRFEASEDDNKKVRIQHCKDKHKYISVNWGTRNLRISPSGSMFKILRYNEHHLIETSLMKTNPPYAIVPIEDPSMAVCVKGGMFVEVHNATALTNLDGLWSFTDAVQEFPKFVHSFRTIADRTAVKKFEPGCISQHKGCCSPKRFHPKLNEPVTTSKPVIAALLTSSRNTLRKRMKFIKRWLFAGDFQAVVTTDCFMPSMVRTLEEYGTFAWLVGPVGTSIKGFSEVSARVPLSIHWMMRNMDPDWFFVVDDDTLVFTHNLFWGLSAFPSPRKVHYLVGHTSEWYQKTVYHGDMPYGGGGVVISSAFKSLWLKKWGEVDNPASSWIQSGEWNHYGGDGALCRLLSWIMREEYGEKRIGYFAEIRGFHQMDLVTSDKILQTVRKTCPVCPSVFNQIGHWFDDVISSQPVITLHHLGAARLGSIFPGERGEPSMENLQNSYFLLHPFVFLRRVCSGVQHSLLRLTLCVNFGRSIQLYDSSGLSPEKAMSVLQKTSMKGNKKEQEKVINMALGKAALSAHIATVYAVQEGSSKEMQLYRASTLQPAPTPSNSNPSIVVTATVGFKLESRPAFACVTLNFNDSSSAFLEIDISHLLKPGVQLTEGKE